MLIGTGLHKAYGRNSILSGVDIKVAPGTITAVIGPSGGGKTTLLKALSLLDPPDAGTVTVDETAHSFPSGASQLSPRPWPVVTIVFQQLFLWPHLTIRQNIHLPLRDRSGVMVEAEIREVASFLEVTDLMDRYPNEVSLGQRQRVAFVRALALRPRYLLLDEITSALDVEHVGRILQCLKDLRSSNVGILLVTHLIGFAGHAADQVVFMEGGVVLEEGPSDVLSRPKNPRLSKFLSLVEKAS